MPTAILLLQLWRSIMSPDTVKYLLRAQNGSWLRTTGRQTCWKWRGYNIMENSGRLAEEASEPICRYWGRIHRGGVIWNDNWFDIFWAVIMSQTKGDILFLLFHIPNFKSRYSRGEETKVQRDKVTLSWSWRILSAMRMERFEVTDISLLKSRLSELFFCL